MKFIEGGVCAPAGFTANGVHCGFRMNRSKRDLSLIASEVRCAAAATYTTNKVKGAPLEVTRAHLADGHAQVIICNSGNANTCNANGAEIAEQTSQLLAREMGISPDDVVVGSTGVIGQPMSLDPFKAGIPQLVSGLSAQGASAAAEGIMTTDTVEKKVAVEFELGGVTCRMGGISKGSGMIHPNMATMLGFITTDAAIEPAVLQAALSADIQDSFNMISVDGDTSTNDMVVVLANGLAGNKPISTAEGADYQAFTEALATVTRTLARRMAADGEGASKLIECVVSGATDKQTARVVAKSVICSSLVKAAIFGADANWGRVLCAIGYAPVDVDVHKVDVRFRSTGGEVLLCEGGAGVPFSEEEAKKVLVESEIQILVDFNSGKESATAWGCDLTYEYVKINGDYRT